MEAESLRINSPRDKTEASGRVDRGTEWRLFRPVSVNPRLSRLDTTRLMCVCGYFLQCCHPRLEGAGEAGVVVGALTGTIYIELAPRCYLL